MSEMLLPRVVIVCLSHPNLCVVPLSRQSNFINRDSVERYMNSPIQFTLDAEIRKAAYTLYNFTGDNAIEGADTIPRSVLNID